MPVLATRLLALSSLPIIMLFSVHLPLFLSFPFPSLLHQPQLTYHLYLTACRSQHLAQSAVTRLQATTGSDKVEYMHLDLSLFASVREFAGSVAERLKAGGEIDVLIRK